MIVGHLFLIALLFVSTLKAEYDLSNSNEDQDLNDLELFKRFLFKKKHKTTTTTSSDAISALVTTTSSSSIKDACNDANPCKNGGTCKTLSSGRHYCYCTDQYYGRNCERKFMSTGYDRNSQSQKDHCASSPCRHSGECISLRTTHYCRCKSPYYGTNCEKSSLNIS